ncbi:MAG: 2-dehydropantoate 2-reductase [Candidatus Competibacteraceae bacterium]|nr:2-dehydropantoate 2-reductase [Candidatus Competibacteraceae bacterium]MCB1812854.1 2-dehydropantoate 2-reductase [Candidatus Competibacteraceae bacterium]
MKICVVGAGSIGGLLGVKLALLKEDVTLIARGAHLAAIKQHGIKLIMNDGTEHVAQDVKATDNMREVGPQDLVILGVKAHQIEPVVEDIRSLIGPDTVVLTTQNGIPWWYFQKLGGEFEGTIVRSVDPNGTLASRIDPARIIGSIAYPAAEIAAPGVIRHVEGLRFPLGELDGSESERVQAISALLVRAGFKAPVLTDIRSELWLKLWGNLSFNPISALTHSTLVDIAQFPLSRQLAAHMMTEAQIIAEKLGATFRVSLEKRIAGAEKVGKHKTSMLQDVEAGKSMEIETMIGAVVELGRLTSTPTPYINAVYACVSLLNKTIEQEGIRIKGEPLAAAKPALRAAG